MLTGRPYLSDDFLGWMERLTGYAIPLRVHCEDPRITNPFDNRTLGVSQFNEIQLCLGYDRVTPAFVSRFFAPNSATVHHPTIASLEGFKSGVDRFRCVAMLLFGNIAFAYKTLSRASTKQELDAIAASLDPISDEYYAARHASYLSLRPIAANDTYYLGYIIEESIKRRMAAKPRDPALQAQWRRLERAREEGRWNHDAYLASDHMDIYIATSMRLRHEYILTSIYTKALMTSPHLRAMKLRWFDPTQAYCPDRLDKGLVEALMLRRAKCTIYMAQESDTLGKDSELACTLAQGKPVVAFVPEIADDAVERWRDWILRRSAPIFEDKTQRQLLRIWMKVYNPDGAWDENDSTIRDWIDDRSTLTNEQIASIIVASAKRGYDSRAKMLSELHPLGIQVNLGTGVANGVLVTRTIAQCAEVVRRVLTHTLEFDIEEQKRQDGRVYILLREKVTRCIYRVVTGDQLLTNAFWNFYLKAPDS